MSLFFKKLRRLITGNNTNYTIDEYRRKGFSIGEDCDILNTQMDCTFAYLTTIGNNVTITGSHLLNHDASTKKFLGYTKVGRIDIGNDVFIGINTVVLPNTTIGNKVIIGSGAVVSGVIPDNSVVVGNPYKIICTFDEYIAKHKKNMESSLLYDKVMTKLSKEEEQTIRSNLKGGIGYGK